MYIFDLEEVDHAHIHATCVKATVDGPVGQVLAGPFIISQGKNKITLYEK